MNRNNLFICWHLGLGDVIICAPIVRQLALVHEMVCIPIKHHNVPSANYLFRDLPNVVIRGVVDDEEMLMFRDQVWKFKVLNLGGFGNGFDGGHWDRSMYTQADIPFNARWDYWSCPRDLKSEHNVACQALSTDLTRRTIFLHEDKERGFRFDMNRLTPEVFGECNMVKPFRGASPILFHWRTVLECCDEINCISSSFAAFIDSVPLPKEPKLFLHAYCRPGEPLCEYRKPWTILT